MTGLTQGSSNSAADVGTTHTENSRPLVSRPRAIVIHASLVIFALAIISYHTGEDRLVKHAFRDWSASCICPPRQLQCTCRGVALGETLTKRPINAEESEVELNTRARSARLRAWRRAA